MSGRSVYTCVVMVAIALLAAIGCRKDQLVWQHVTAIDTHGQTDELHRVLFTDALHGYVFGGNLYQDAVILYTNDGGATWTRTASKTVGELLLAGTVSPSGVVYSCGYEGKLIYNPDSPDSWSFHQMEDYWFRDIAFTDSGHAIVVGGISFNSGMMHHIDKFGNRLQRDSVPYQYNRIRMVDGHTGFVCGYGIVLKTTDGGISWNILDPTGDNFTGITIIDQDVWICGYYGCIFHSTDLGNHWTRYRNGNDITQEKYRLNDLLFTDKMHGWAVGEDGKIVSSSDGGNHWSEYTQFTTSTFYSIAQKSDGSLFVAGAQASLYHILP
jgi:photosystem II stability/assembly factor-like uncharacterized protein